MSNPYDPLRRAPSPLSAPMSYAPGTVGAVGEGSKKAEGMSPWWLLAIGGAAVVGVGIIVNASKPKDNPVKLLSADRSKAAQARIRKAAASRFGRGKAHLFFQDGQWFARGDLLKFENEQTYAVVDEQPGVSDTGVDFVLTDASVDLGNGMVIRLDIDDDY